MAFHEIRRQQFLGEADYLASLKAIDTGIAALEENFIENSGFLASQMRLSMSIAGDRFIKLCLHYTAGEPIAPLRAELEEVIAAYERYGEHLWQYTGDRNEVVFKFYSLDDYCQLLQLIGLCFLLHRRDLLPRLAAMQDGDAGANGGADTIYEEFMIHVFGPELRYQSETANQVRPYENLFYALTEDDHVEQLKELNLFLKHWYKDLAGTGWHDSHKEDGSGYYGYWSFEAGAAVLLLGIEDDSSLHKYLYYPKDLVAWCREHAADYPDGGLGSAPKSRPNVPGGQPCPEAGWWFTPAKTGSRRYFKQGETMPSLGSDYGHTFWQWASEQTAPEL